jgi:hypothetical protein
MSEMPHIAKWEKIPDETKEYSESGVYFNDQPLWLSRDHKYRCKVCGKKEYSVYDIFHPMELKGLSKIHW